VLAAKARGPTVNSPLPRDFFCVLTLSALKALTAKVALLEWRLSKESENSTLTLYRALSANDMLWLSFLTTEIVERDDASDEKPPRQVAKTQERRNTEAVLGAASMQSMLPRATAPKNAEVNSTL